MLKITRVSLFLIILFLHPHALFSQITKTSSNVFYGLGEALRYHYSLIPLHEPGYSEEVFENLFINMDPQKLFFTKEDINGFNGMRLAQGEMFETGDLSLPYSAHAMLLEKSKKRLSKAIKLIDNNTFDYTRKNDSLVVDLKKRNWAENDSDLDLRWKKVIKNKLLAAMIQEKFPNKNTSETIKGSIISELKAIADGHQNANEFEIIGHYANAFLIPVDPHSSYMIPQIAQDFNDKLSSSLQMNDVIVEVKGEEDKEYISTIGKNPEYVSSLIKGPKGTKVIVKVISETGKRKTICIVRDKVDIQEHMISSRVYEAEVNKGPIKIGIITIPIFYSNSVTVSETAKIISVADDFARELITLKELHKVDGVLIDVRNNIGGSLSEVVQMAGNLIKSGPVVSVMDSVEGETTKYDTDDTILYDGPLAIVVNRFSASASEILAGFIKDYNRGIVIGETTHGKGTAQAMLEITQEMYPHLDRDYGTFKFTTKMFFRVNGQSTQKNGVVPHIKYPSDAVANVFSESRFPNAINSEVLFQKKIPQSNGFIPIDLDQLQDNGSNNVYARAMKKIEGEKGFMLLQTRMELINKSLLREAVSLNEKERRTQTMTFEKQMAIIIQEISNSTGVSAENIPGGKSAHTAEKSFNAAVDTIEIQTAADILADYISQTN